MEKQTRKPYIAKRPAPKKQAPPATAIKTDTWSKSGVIFFFITLAISYFIFANDFFNIKELSNPYIKAQASWVITLQFIIYTMLFGIFGYFGFRFITGK